MVGGRLTEEQLAEIEAAEQKATPGPWDANAEGEIFVQDGEGIVDTFGLKYIDNAMFIALLRNHARALVAEIRALREFRDDVHDQLIRGDERAAICRILNELPMVAAADDDTLGRAIVIIQARGEPESGEAKR